MELHRQNAFKQRQAGFIVGKVQDQLAVHVVLDVVTFGDDHDIIPVVEAEEFLPTLFVNQIRLFNLLAGSLPGRFFTDQADAAAFAAFVVDKP